MCGVIFTIKSLKRVLTSHQQFEVLKCIGGILRRRLESFSNIGKCHYSEKWKVGGISSETKRDWIAFVWKYYLCSFLATDNITIVRILFSLRIPAFTEVFIKVKWRNLSQNLFGIQKLKAVRVSILTAKNAFLKKS